VAFVQGQQPLCRAPLSGRYMRAAVLMTLIDSAKLNGHDAWGHLKDVLTKLPTWPNRRLHELLAHRWVPPETAATPSIAAVNT
jgi:transposase